MTADIDWNALIAGTTFLPNGTVLFQPTASREVLKALQDAHDAGECGDEATCRRLRDGAAESATYCTD